MDENADTITLSDSDEIQNDLTPENSTSRGFQDELNEAMKKIANKKQTTNVTFTKKTLERDLKLFEATGEKTKTITLLNNIVLSVPPSSTEPERAFSLAGVIVTKFRNRLSDDAVDALLFLKYYFKKCN